jgi:2-iminobutanoate/2-iminopropanoate deaminase
MADSIRCPTASPGAASPDAARTRSGSISRRTFFALALAGLPVALATLVPLPVGTVLAQSARIWPRIRQGLLAGPAEGPEERLRTLNQGVCMSQELKTVQTPAAPAAIGPYSQAVTYNGLVFLSGQLGINPATGAIPEDFAAQARQALDNVRAVVEAAGSNLTRVLSVDVFLIDMGRFSEFNEIYSTYFTSHKPARAAVAVAALPREAQVEVRVVAAQA